MLSLLYMAQIVCFQKDPTTQQITDRKKEITRLAENLSKKHHFLTVTNKCSVYVTR